MSDKRLTEFVLLTLILLVMGAVSAYGFGHRKAVLAAQQLAPVDLAELIKTATAADVIPIPAGSYGKLTLRDLSFEQPVILSFGEGAIVETISLYNVSGLTFRNLNIRAGKIEDETKIDWVFAVTLLRSHHIRFSGGRILWSADGDGTNDGKGFNIRESADVEVTGVTFNDNYRGIMVRDSDRVTLTHNKFIGVRSDGINVSGSVDVTIRDNLCRDFFPDHEAGDHPDCIQFWNDTASRSNQRVLIADNQIIRGRGGVSQGIFVSGLKQGLPNKEFIIRDNVIEQGMGHGIMIHRSDGVEVHGNKITPSQICPSYAGDQCACADC